MLDIKYIRENPKKVEEALLRKNFRADIASLLELDEKRRKEIQEIDELRAMHNAASKQISKASGDDRKKGIEEIRAQKETLDKQEQKLAKVDQEFEARMIMLPNIPFDDVPIGKDESENVVIREVGEKPHFDFKPIDYLTIADRLDLIDMERAAKVSGSRFSYLKKDAALLEFALIQFSYSILTSREILRSIIQKAGLTCSDIPFIPVIPPVMIRPEIFTKMARLTLADKNERYYMPVDDLYLIGSAEHTLGPLHLDEVLEEKKLPIRYLGYSPSFRREAGSYGKDMKGTMRVHQFNKIEMESFTAPEQGMQEHLFLVAIQEHLMQALKIPYRVVNICTGDMGAPDAHQIDIECWMPGQGKYRETHTADYMTDYQARRLRTRVKRENGDTVFVHMNDATAIAMSRVPIAIIENYQTAEGFVNIPDALKPWMHGIEIIKR